MNTVRAVQLGHKRDTCEQKRHEWDAISLRDIRKDKMKGDGRHYS